MTSEVLMSRLCEILLALVLIVGWNMEGDIIPRAKCEERHGSW